MCVHEIGVLLTVHLHLILQIKPTELSSSSIVK